MVSRGREHDESAAKIDDDSIDLMFKHGEAEVEVDLSQWSKEVKVSLDSTWAIIALPTGGYMPMQLY